MDAAVVAAMITAGTKISTSLFEKWSGQSEDQKTRDFVEQHYNSLKGLLSDNCVRLLKRMEDGQNRTASDLITHLYPEQAKNFSAELERLQSEFEYRLFFMSLAGVIIRPTREYCITEVGKAFLNSARERKDYFKVLFD